MDQLRILSHCRIYSPTQLQRLGGLVKRGHHVLQTGGGESSLLRQLDQLGVTVNESKAGGFLQGVRHLRKTARDFAPQVVLLDSQERLAFAASTFWDTPAKLAAVHEVVGEPNDALLKWSKVKKVLVEQNPAFSSADDGAAYHKWVFFPQPLLKLSEPATFELDALNIPNGAFIAILVGETQQAILKLVQVAHWLPMDVPIHFLVVAPEPLWPLIRKEVRKLLLPQRFHFADAQHQVQSIMENCGVCVVTARELAQGNAALTAMSVGVPVVSTEAGADDGIMFAPDEEQLAHALLELFEDPASRRNMGQRMLAKATERFDPPASSASLSALLSDLTGGGFSG